MLHLPLQLMAVQVPVTGTAGVTPDPADATTISVGDASPGSGTGTLELAQAVTINSQGNTLTFIYTPSGAITDRELDIRVDVPSGWSAPTDRVDADARGSFTVTHKKLDANKTLKLQTAAAAAVEKIGPFDRQMAARLKHGSNRWLPVTKLSSITRMLTLPQRLEPPHS